MSFTVTILGSGAALPTARRNPTAQYIICNDRHILIDCGEGTQMQLRNAGIKIQRINHILISHLHGDHFFGLVGLISTMHLLGRDKGLTIYGPEQLEQIVRMQLEVGAAKLNFDIRFVVLNGKENCLLFEDKLIEIHAFPLKHRIPTTGFLIKEKIHERKLIAEAVAEAGLKLEHLPLLKKGMNITDENGQEIDFEDFTLPPKPSYSYAYCSDTAYWETVIPFIQNASVLYHEATFVEKEKDRAKATFHSTAKQAAKIAHLANVGKLLLGHLSARYSDGLEHEKEAQSIFEKSEVVEDGKTYFISL
ncbi:MAG: ribonuclease Z [Crocinitomicaceae bacterium]|nr:ribonuclease Z [Crocinitomicaceae bacterium]